MIDKKYYVNVADLMPAKLKKPKKKRENELPIIEVTTGIWSVW